jgi:hypothetical protein
MAKTRAQAAEAILRKLYVMSGNDPAPSAEDSASLLIVFDARTDYLRDDELAYWPAEEIPDAVFDPLCEYMLFYVAPVFTPEAGEDQRWAARSQMGMSEMRRVLAKRSDGAPVRADYF